MAVLRSPPLAELLRSDDPISLRDWAIALADLPYRASLEMVHSLRTGASAFRKAFGMTLFDYLAGPPGGAIRLFRGMSSISAARTAGLLEAYDFSAIRGWSMWGRSRSDSRGYFNAVSEHPLSCFDLPRAEQGALQTIRDSGVADQCDFVGGDFFEDVPAGADAYIISAVLQDWGDERCLQILRNCRRRVPDRGRVLVIDIVLSDEKTVPDTYRNYLDLGMLTQTEGGMERTESEFRKLASDRSVQRQSGHTHERSAVGNRGSTQ